MFLKRIFITCTAFICSINFAYAIETHSKLWTALYVHGSIFQHEDFRYYLEADTRLIDDKYKFESFLLWMGVGYRFKPTMTFYVGYMPDILRTLHGDYIKQNTLWQQLSWDAYTSQRFQFITLTRLESTKRAGETDWRVVLRQGQAFKFPLESWINHSLVIGDTVFFDLKAPAWTGVTTLISQNRAFIGIETRLANRDTYVIGYMNQYFFLSPNRMDHILNIEYHFNNT